ncbi:MAG: head-tail adaptor protein [Caldilineaceae bacterium]|nr:head-tail adaptor protein [Caldilineaceae bacterium]
MGFAWWWERCWRRCCSVWAAITFLWCRPTMRAARRVVQAGAVFRCRWRASPSMAYRASFPSISCSIS